MQNKSLGKGYPRFIRQIHWIEHHLAPSSKASQMQTRTTTLLTNVNFGSKFVFKKLTFILLEEVPKPTELLLRVRGQSLDQQLPVSQWSIR